MRMRISIGSTCGSEHVDAVGVDDDLAVVAIAGIQIVHAVEAAQERRLAATGGTDQCGHFVLGQTHGDGFERLHAGAVKEAQATHFRLDRFLGDARHRANVRTQGSIHDWPIHLITI